MRCECEDCDWHGIADQLGCEFADIPDLYERLDIGSEVPAGECPDCGCLAYLVEDDNVYYADVRKLRAEKRKAIDTLRLCVARLSEYPDAAGGIALELGQRVLNELGQ